MPERLWQISKTMGSDLHKYLNNPDQQVAIVIFVACKGQSHQ